MLEALDRKTFCTFVPDPFVSREDLLKMLLIDFGVMSVDDLKSGRLHAATRPELSYPLYDFLKSLVPLQAYAVLILDEAQNLTSQLLEEIRILADLEGPEKLLQLVLVGQPELHDKLNDPAMRQVDQRISVRCSLETLDQDALAGYLAHRLTVAGGVSDGVEFWPDALDVLYRIVEGKSPCTQPDRRQVSESGASRTHLDHHAGDRDRRARRSWLCETRGRRSPRLIRPLRPRRLSCRQIRRAVDIPGRSKAAGGSKTPLSDFQEPRSTWLLSRTTASYGPRSRSAAVTRTGAP